MTQDKIEYFPNGFNPLKNYREVFWYYETFLINVESRLRFNKKFDDIFQDIYPEILNIVHRAKQELENLIVIPNSNTIPLILKTAKEIDKLDSNLRSFIKKHKVAHVDNVAIGRKILPLFHPALKFKEWFDELKSNYLPQPETIAIQKEKNEVKKPKRKSKAEEDKGKTLKQIWLTTPEHFDDVVAFLKKENTTIQSSFVNNDNTWVKNPVNSFTPYIVGFLKTCIEKNWIEVYSAPVLKALMKNTFNIEFDGEPLKSIKSNPIDEKYLKPFKNLPPINK